MLGSKKVVGFKRGYGGRSIQKKKKTKTNMVQAVSTKSMQRRALGTTLPSTLHFIERFTLNPGVGGLASEYFFRLSSIFDPNFTGVGHQPNGHDQLSVLFERYQVWKVDFHIELINGDSTGAVRVGYRLSDQSTGVASATELVENGGAEWTLLGVQGGTDKARFIGSVRVCDVHGISYKQYMANDDYGANFGSNPAEEAYLSVWADGLGDDTGAIDAVIHMVMHTKCMGSKLAAQN